MKKVLFCIVLVFFTSNLWAQTSDPAKYVDWMKQSLPEVPAWNEWQQQSGELPPDFEKLPKSNLLPDPLYFLDGRPVQNNASDWAARRAEIKQLFETYMVGTFPPKPPIDRINVLDETHGNGYTVRNVQVFFGPQSQGSVRIRVVIPNGAPGEKFPVLICPNLNGWGAQLVRRGYISAGYAGNDGMDDAAPLKELYPDYDFATLSRRAWLAQIVVDYLETLPQVNMEQIAMFGYSRDGKMATIAVAWDDRIAALVAGSTGVGGLQPWRFGGERGGGEGIESTTKMFPDWFIPRLRFFSGREDRLPIDANLFLALLAPRAALIEWGWNDQVANGWGIEQAFASAQTVYERMGYPDRLGLLNVPGFHGSNDQEACIDWLDWQFGRSPKAWVNDFVFPWSFEAWQELSGEKINLNEYPVVQPLSASAWKTQAPKVKASIEWMLGDTPPVLDQSGAPAIPARMLRPTPSVIEVASGTIGNPGQLAPDVPAWVIAGGGVEFGWIAPERDQVDSRRIRFGGVTGDLFYPKGTPEGTQLPTVIWLHGFHHPLGYMWVYRRDLHPILALVKAGYAVLAYDQSGYGTRFREAEPFYDRFPHWSRMGKMVEDVSNAVTALEQDKIVDPQHISVFGYTLGGTIGLYAAALDPRINGVVSICGFTPMRNDTPEKGMSGMTRYSHQHGLIPRLGLFAENESRLPYDYDEVIALIAPRPVLVVQPTMDRDADPDAVRATVNRAKAVFTAEGASGNLGLQEPEDIGRLTNETQEQTIEWMNRHLK